MKLARGIELTSMKNSFERNHCDHRNDSEARKYITELFAISMSCKISGPC